MSNGKKWDLTSTRSLESACEWIRKDSRALFVVAVRAGVKPDDDGRHTMESAIAADPEMPIKDILQRLEIEIAALTVALMKQRDTQGNNPGRVTASIARRVSARLPN
jgi:hypothetical protein